MSPLCRRSDRSSRSGSLICLWVHLAAQTTTLRSSGFYRTVKGEILSLAVLSAPKKNYLLSRAVVDIFRAMRSGSTDVEETLPRFALRKMEAIHQSASRMLSTIRLERLPNVIRRTFRRKRSRVRSRGRDRGTGNALADEPLSNLDQSGGKMRFEDSPLHDIPLYDIMTQDHPRR